MAFSCFSGRLVGASDEIFYRISPDNELRSGSRDEFYSAVRDLIESTENARPTIVGHSYGGWNALQLMLNLGSLGVRELITIDPISPEGCTPFNILRGNIPGRNGAPGCLQAPADVGSAARQNIARATTTWTNFFQTDFGFLHSGPMAEATANRLLNYGDDVVNAHSAIDNDPRVWEVIEKPILEDLANAVGEDLALGLSESSSANRAQFFLSAPIATATVAICRGIQKDCTPDLSDSVVIFRLDSESNIAGRKVFRAIEKISFRPQLPYTLAAADNTGKVTDRTIVTLQPR